MKKLIALVFPLYCAAILTLLSMLSQYNAPPSSEQPIVLLPDVVPDFKEIKDKKLRKRTFFAYMKPMIDDQNRQLLQQREELTALQQSFNKNGSLTEEETMALTDLAQHFELEETDSAQLFADLDERVNILPEAMVLAQAAKESAWGTSRFARTGNNFFGQWCYEEGCGLVPKKRKEGAYHEVTKYNSASESVQAYFHNINTHQAYHDLREIRLQHAKEGRAISALALVDGLGSYSERGMTYVEELKKLIRHNKLEPDTTIESNAARSSDETNSG